MTNLDPGLVLRIWMLRQQKKSVEADLADALAELAASKPERTSVGGLIVNITETKRFDPATAKANLTPEQFEAICETVPTTAQAKRVLGSDDYAKTQRVNGYTVKIDPPGDEVPDA